MKISRLTILVLTLAAAACAPDTPTAPNATLAPPGTAAADKQVVVPSGTLNLCKQAGAGLAAGIPFRFSVTLGTVPRTVSVATGSCVAFGVPRESEALSKGYFGTHADAVAALLPGGTTLTIGGAALTSAQLQAILGGSNASAPSALLLNLAQQLIAAELNVLRGVPPSGAVTQAIADANAALQITAGSSVQITSALTSAQASTLVTQLAAFNEGKTKPAAPSVTATLQIAESLGAQSVLAVIACVPSAQCTNANVSAGTVTASVASGATTTVTYTNKARTALQVCKAAGPGVVAGTVYHFGVVAVAPVTGGTSLDVPAGQCRDANLAPGSYTVQETVPDNFAVNSIVCAPADRCGAPTYADASIVASVVDASTTTVTYTNQSLLGTLRICKVAGPGIVASTVYDFDAPRLGPPGSNRETFAVPAGECREATIHIGPYAISETVPDGTAASAIECAPVAACGTPALGSGFVIATVSAAQTVTVTYTNRVTLGTIRVCMAAGTGVAPGSAFHVLIVRAGVGPGSTGFDLAVGQCRDSSVPEGFYFVTEILPSGYSFASIVCDVGQPCHGPSDAGASAGLNVIALSTATITYTNDGPAMLRAAAAKSSP